MMAVVNRENSTFGFGSCSLGWVTLSLCLFSDQIIASSGAFEAFAGHQLIMAERQLAARRQEFFQLQLDTPPRTQSMRR
ncbi:hypothetical protein H6P81_000634 [Aristolochia fimbriata]|uniref:Uncharacterized protein n=1 Tax=Aristolochia fimbriata TaxID=158543 RepID=A0AAV7F5Z2_ARIFI|nr:hypothetical protein H6P81_000634 [Aristolochia fimbriata]